MGLLMSNCCKIVSTNSQIDKEIVDRTYICNVGYLIAEIPWYVILSMN